jgi:hypothetical protein
MESDRRRDAYNKAEVTNTMCYRYSKLDFNMILIMETMICKQINTLRVYNA